MLAIVAAFKAFVKQAQDNHLDYCKAYVKKHEAKPEAKQPAKKS